MNLNEYNLWHRLTFRTLSYKKNFDLINKYESFITEHNGTISEINISEALPPTIVGEYGYSVWDIELGKKFDFNVSKLLTKYRFQDTYSELLRLKKEDKFDFSTAKRIVMIHSLVLHPDYKKRGVTEEFIEFLYREFYGDEIIALIKPIQYNEIDYEHFYNHNIVRLKKDVTDPNSYTNIKASDYYKLDDLALKTDIETNELKLYALAARMGFQRMDDSYLFVFTPDKIIERMKTKFADLSKFNE